MKSKTAKTVVMLGLLSLMFGVGVASAQVEKCVQQQKCIDGPDGSSICAFVEVCQEP